ncbi:MAG TPA: CPBP family intramembrane metalloprotease [Peptococcaceae bacterium]|nr:CPBP family intramembrane metalloprotease [Peptococcaceae bacterium]
MPYKKIKDSQVIITLTLALIFWYLTFSVQLLNFWLSMSIAATTLSILAIFWGGLPFRKEDITLRGLFIGVASAIILYFIFWLGNIISQLLFNFAGSQISSIYNIRTQGNVLIIVLVLLFITSPGEEIFWRNFLQKWAMEKFGEFQGWLIGSIIYAGVHISSGNFMLTMAALVAGLFWGFIYMYEKNVFPLIISHALWTVGIFILFPVV